jgi:hypothetical protein
MKSDPWKPVLLALAVLSFANGLWMILDAAGWYRDLPAAVPDFGPLNEHFVRDLGSAFVTFAVALGWAALAPPTRGPLVAVTALFYVLHAAAHVHDTARGLVGADHWWIDLPGVYLPALLLLALAVMFLRRPTAA